MSPLENHLRGADAKAAQLGHAIVWNTMSERMADGQCSGCGQDVTVAMTHRGLGEHTGRALQENCTRDLVIEKPSLRRPLVATER